MNIKMGTVEGDNRAKGKGDGVLIVLRYFICMYENRIMRPIKNSKKGE
jgi:hypothetical protein